MRCPECGKYMTEASYSWYCVCGYEEVVIEPPQEKSHQTIVNEEIHDNFWYGAEPTTEEAQEYCDYWHGG